MAMHRFRRALVAIGAVTASIGAPLALATSQAHATATQVITVTTTADVVDANGCTAGNPCSLEDAATAAAQVAGPVTVSIPAGTYVIGGSNPLPGGFWASTISIVGAGPKTVLQYQLPTGVSGGAGYALSLGGSGASGSSATVSDLTLRGAGLSVSGYDTATVERVQVFQPLAEGVLSSNKQLTVDATTVQGQVGYPQANVSLQGIKSTSGNATITNTTVDAMPTGVLAYGVNLTLVNDTLTDSWIGANYTGSGLANYAYGGTVTVRNTLFARNAKSSCEAVGDNPFTATDHNMTEDQSCGFAGPGDVTMSSPGVGALADNGGPVETEALQTGSPAIGAAINCPPTDARGVARPSSPCDIGAYEGGTLPSPGFTWALRDRFGPRDEYGLVNYHYCAPERPTSQACGATGGTPYQYDPLWVHPRVLWADFNGCATPYDAAQPAGKTAYDYRWIVMGTPANVDGHTCRFSYDFPVDGNGRGTPTEVRLVITDASGNTPPTVVYPNGTYYSQVVTVRDLLVVSFGDSYGSGEGTPDVPLTSTAPAQWEDRRCHRSAAAGPAQAALKLEASDPHTSVTFLSFACSGATIDTHSYGNANALDPYAPTNGSQDQGTGVLGPYRGIEPPTPSYDQRTYLPPQVQQIARTVQSRRIDALVGSAGGNDMGFASVATVCVLTTACYSHDVTDVDGSQQPLATRVQHDLAGLNGKYAELAAALDASGISASKLYLTEYPDPTRAADTTFCTSMLGDVVPAWAQVIGGLLVSLFPGIGVAATAAGLNPPYQMSVDEVAWAGQSVSPGLNATIAGVAQRYGADRIPWQVVTGIAGDFRGASDGTGHGYCAGSASWIRNATDSAALEGPTDTTKTTGTLHPNDAGGRAIGRRVAAQLLADYPPQ